MRKNNINIYKPLIFNDFLITKSTAFRNPSNAGSLILICGVSFTYAGIAPSSPNLSTFILRQHAAAARASRFNPAINDDELVLTQSEYYYLFFCIYFYQFQIAKV